MGEILLLLLVLLLSSQNSLQDENNSLVDSCTCTNDKEKLIGQLCEGQAPLLELKTSMTSEVSRMTEQMNSTLKELKDWIASEFSTVKVEAKKAAEKSLLCSHWISRLDGLELKKLDTGVYYYPTEEKIHSVASDWCEAHGMRLARFESMEEMKVVGENAPTDSRYWVGAWDTASTPGEFKWSDGRKVEASFWHRGRPNQFIAGKKTCVWFYVQAAYDKLLDYPCTYPRYFICEVDALYLGCL